MIGDLMGNLQQKQAELKASLSQIEIVTTVENIIIKGNAAKEIAEVTIGDAYLAAERKEELEELLCVAFNKHTEQVAAEEAKASQSMISDLLPGMGGLLGL